MSRLGESAPPADGAPPLREITVDQTASERRILFLIGAVQFVNVVDFMMVMPLGRDFSLALHIPTDRLGLVGGAYTAAAAVSGLLSARFLDRFDRRSALGVAMLGLVCGTALGGFAIGMGSLMAARMIAGAFGGPATSLALSIVGDSVPPARRGKALGSVMGAFSVASVFGVPIGLKLAELGSWRTPFFSVAGVGLLVAGSAVRVLPPLRGHLEPGRRVEAPEDAGPLWRRRVVWISLTTTALIMAGNFTLLPFLSPYLQQNLHFPRAHLGWLYAAGGVVTFGTMRATGRFADRLGEVRVAAVATAWLVAVLFVGFVRELPIPVVLLFVAFMVGSSTRNVAMSTLTSKVPRPWERARFLSTQSVVQHVASAAGAVLGSHLVRGASAELPIEGVPRLATVTAALAAAAVLSMAAVKRRIVREA